MLLKFAPQQHCSVAIMNLFVNRTALCLFHAHAFFRPNEFTTTVTSFCGKPDAQVVISDNGDEVSTPLNLEVPPLINSELTDMTSITYHPYPLIVSASSLLFCFAV